MRTGRATGPRGAGVQPAPGCLPLGRQPPQLLRAGLLAAAGARGSRRAGRRRPRRLRLRARGAVLLPALPRRRPRRVGLHGRPDRRGPQDRPAHHDGGRQVHPAAGGGLGRRVGLGVGGLQRRGRRQPAARGAVDRPGGLRRRRPRRAALQHRAAAPLRAAPGRAVRRGPARRHHDDLRRTDRLRHRERRGGCRPPPSRADDRGEPAHPLPQRRGLRRRSRRCGGDRLELHRRRRERRHLRRHQQRDVPHRRPRRPARAALALVVRRSRRLRGRPARRRLRLHADPDGHRAGRRPVRRDHRRPGADAPRADVARPDPAGLGARPGGRRPPDRL